MSRLLCHMGHADSGVKCMRRFCSATGRTGASCHDRRTKEHTEYEYDTSTIRVRYEYDTSPSTSEYHTHSTRIIAVIHRVPG